MSPRAALSGLAPFLLLAGRLLAAEGSAGPKPLSFKDDPAIIAKIKALKPNTSMLLPQFKVTGVAAGEKHTWNFSKNGPYKRDWSNKMPYNPDLKVGMYAGGNHGNPKYNDCWGYHLGSNTWHRFFAPVGGDQGRFRGWVKGSKEKNRQMVKDIVVFEEGYLQTKGHGLYYVSHIWDGITYDPGVKRMLWVNPFSYANLEHYAGVTGRDYEKLKAQAKEGTKLWMYDTAKGRWYRHVGSKPYPQFDVSTCGASLLYIPDWKKSLYYSAGWKSPGTWTYDAVNNAWERLKVKVKPGKGMKPPQDKQMAYSPKHKKVVAVFEKSTWILDIQTLTWSKEADHAGNEASDGYALFCYSPGTDEFLLLSGQSRKRKNPVHLSSFDLKTRKWREVKHEGPAVHQKSYPGGFFHPELGVLVAYTGERDSKHIWIYRPGE